MNQNQQEFDLGSAFFQLIFGVTRLILFGLILYYFTTSFSMQFHGKTPDALITDLLIAHPYMQNWPRWLDWLITLIALTNKYFIRYAIAPLFAIFTVLLAGAMYVKDVYALPGLGVALQYVLASMFPIPFGSLNLKIDKGVMQLRPNEFNLLNTIDINNPGIGGPGVVIVEPGSAAIFRQLRAPSRSTISGTRELAPFEVLSDAIDLAEQQCDKDEVGCVTRDGLKIVLRDVHFRYRIKSDAPKDAPIHSGVHYPSETALKNRTYSLSVTVDGPEKWNAAVEGKIVGAMIEFISTHSLDFLTAPREDDRDPRRELLDNLTRSAPGALDPLGAELIWADFGHMEIVEGVVDDQRVSQWAVDWIGDAKLARAYGDAKRQAYKEMGRAEAQAEMIIGIADALHQADLIGNATPENLRKVWLARTAQMLDAIGTNLKHDGGGKLDRV